MDIPANSESKDEDVSEDEVQAKELEKTLALQMYNTIHSQVKHQFDIQREQKQLMELKKELQDRKNTNKMLQNELVSLQDLNKYHKENRKDVVNELEGAKKIVKVLNQYSIQMESKLQVNNEINESNKNKIKQIMQDFKNIKTNNSVMLLEIEKEICRIRENMAFEEKQFSIEEKNLKNECATFQEKYASKKDQLVHKKREAEMCELKLKESNAKVCELKTKMEQLEANKLEVLEKFSKLNAKANEEISVLRDKLVAAKTKNDDSVKGFNESKENNLSLRENLTQLNAENISLCSHIETLETESSELKQKRNNATENLNELQKQLENTCRDETEAKEEFEKQMTLYEEKTTEISSKNDNLRSDSSQMKEKINDMKKTLEEIEIESQTLKIKLEKNQVCRNNVEQELKTLVELKNQKVSVIREEEAAQNSAKKELESILEEKEKTIKNLEDLKNTSISECDAEIRKRELSFSKSKEDAIRTFEGSIAEVKNKIAEAEKRNADLKSLQGDIQKLKKLKLNVKTETLKVNYLREKFAQRESAAMKEYASPAPSQAPMTPKSPTGILKRGQGSSLGPNQNRVTFNENVFEKSPSESSETNPEEADTNEMILKQILNAARQF